VTSKPRQKSLLSLPWAFFLTITWHFIIMLSSSKSGLSPCCVPAMSQVLGFRSERQSQVQERCRANYSVLGAMVKEQGEPRKRSSPTWARVSGSLPGVVDISIQSWRTTRGCPGRGRNERGYRQLKQPEVCEPPGYVQVLNLASLPAHSLTHPSICSFNIYLWSTPRPGTVLATGESYISKQTDVAPEPMGFTF
jgi:hypothetical protein